MLAFQAEKRVDSTPITARQKHLFSDDDYIEEGGDRGTQAIYEGHNLHGFQNFKGLFKHCYIKKIF